MDYNSISSSSKYFITAEQLERVADAIRENCTLNDTKLSYPWGFIEKTSNINGIFENFLNGTMSNVYLKVESLASYIFYGYSNLISINCPFCSTIGNSAFYRCSNLTSISFPTCTLIGGSAFNNCSNLTSIYLNNSSVCTLYASNAFGATQITSTTGSIYVPASLLTEYQSAPEWSYFSTQFFSIS